MSIDFKNPINCTSLKSKRLARAISRVYDHEMADLGIKSAQYGLLTHVLRRGPITLSALAELMGMDISTLSRNLQPLEREKWIIRVAGNDARTRCVQITQMGLKVQSRSHKRWLRGQEKVNAAIGLERVSALHALMEQSLAAIKTIC